MRDRRICRRPRDGFVKMKREIFKAMPYHAIERLPYGGRSMVCLLF